jgi:hypothetical protein
MRRFSPVDGCGKPRPRPRICWQLNSYDSSGLWKALWID